MRRAAAVQARHRVPAVPAGRSAPSGAGNDARAASGPATCARTPAGAGNCSVPASQNSPHESAGNAVSCAVTPRSACAVHAGSVIPTGPYLAAENLIARLADPPAWLPDFVAYLAARHGASRCCTMISSLGRLLADEASQSSAGPCSNAPADPGRSMGSLARGLEDFFTERRLALPTDQPERLAAGRRRRRVEAVPEPLRAAVDGVLHQHAAALRNAPAEPAPGPAPTAPSRWRWPRHGTSRSSSPISEASWIGRWSTSRDIEAFLATRPKMRARHLTVLRQFFAFRPQPATGTGRPDPRRAISIGSVASPAATVILDQQRAAVPSLDQRPAGAPA